MLQGAQTTKNNKYKAQTKTQDKNTHAHFCPISCACACVCLHVQVELAALQEKEQALLHGFRTWDDEAFWAAPSCSKQPAKEC